MKDFWNQRYQREEYVYGEAPNPFFKQWIDTLPAGRILLPAEGEGRNAVYAARRGWQVDAFDFSEAGREKALALANQYRASINYTITDYNNVSILPETYDAVALIYAHMPSSIRRRIHCACAAALKNGGQLALEAFTKEQLQRDSGGPKNPDMLYTPDELREDFADLEILRLEQLDIERREGLFHQGPACLVQLIAQRRL